LLADYTNEFVCVMYYSTAAFRCPQHNDRSDLYHVSGVPVAWFDGFEQVLGGMGSGSMYDNYKPVVEAHLANPSPLELGLTLTVEGQGGEVRGQVEITEAMPVPGADYVVQVVLYEVHGDRTPNLARDFPVYNVPLTISSVGEIQDIQGTFTMGEDWNRYNLEAILFVQDTESPYNILQAGRGEVTIEPSPVILTGPGPGVDNANYVRGYNPWNTSTHMISIHAYNPDRYGVNVAAGDIDDDGFDDIITGPGPGAVFGPQVRVFDYLGAQLAGASFLAYGTNKYGVNVAAGDIDGDGYKEIVTGAGPGAVFGPHVRGWNHDGSGAVTSIGGISYFAYGTPKWGVNVCSGDLDGDGYDEIVTGAGPGAVYGPHVRGWNYDNSSISAMSTVSFLAYGTNKFGVNVACGDIDGDGFDEIVTGPGPGAVFGPHVRGWNTDGGNTTSIGAISFFAFDYSEWGCNVGCGDIDGDGIDEILVGAGPGPSYDAWVEAYNYDGGSVTMTHEFTSFPGAGMTHGVNVAGANF